MSLKNAIYENEDVVDATRAMCVAATMSIVSTTEGVGANKTKSAAGLEENVKLVELVVDHELTRVFGV